jgi:Na+/proline symporter
MAIRSAAEMPTARRVAMGWVIVVLLAAVVVGLAGVALIAPPLAGPDSEKVFILLSTAHLHPVLAGLCLSGILAAIMSTASAQLLVASSAFAQDFYKGLFRKEPGRAELLWVGRGAVLAIALLAYLLALNPESKVLDLVAWAWAGFGAAFRPAIVLSLYWDRMTRWRARGMLVGGLTVILWKQGAAGFRPVRDGAGCRAQRAGDLDRQPAGRAPAERGESDAGSRDPILRLNPGLDARSIAAVFARHGRVHIRHLPERRGRTDPARSSRKP